MDDFSFLPKDKCLKTSEAAEYLGLSKTTLKSYRADGIGPKYVQFGTIIRYRLSDIKKWCEAHISAPSAQRKII